MIIILNEYKERHLRHLLILRPRIRLQDLSSVILRTLDGMTGPHFASLYGRGTTICVSAFM